MTMYGNDDTGETVEIDFHPNARMFIAVQHVGPNQTKSAGVLHQSSYHQGMKQWWDEYKSKSQGKFYKLVRHVFAAPPMVTELTEDVQGVEVPYTDSSDGRHLR